MNESEEYIYNAIKTYVYSGFYDEPRIQEMISDIMEDDADEAILRKIPSELLKKKAQEERSWPSLTDCDRLNRSFMTLNSENIISIQNAGYTSSDGHEEVGKIHKTKPYGTFRGYCFYHGQDLERAVNGDGLMLAFGDMKDTEDGKQLVANRIIEVLIGAGLDPKWTGETNRRIEIPGLKWMRRYSGGA
jgi:hypothetical protein